MARLLRKHEEADDLCADLKEKDKKKHRRHHDDDCHCDHHHDHFDCKDRKKFIPIGQITVDCSPVFFETPRQAMAILGGPLSQVFTLPLTTIVEVQVPLTTPVNLPASLIPVPTVICPQAASPLFVFSTC